jgi:hypothetical protein
VITVPATPESLFGGDFIRFKDFGRTEESETELNARAMVKMKLKLPEHVDEEKRLYNECAYAFGGNPWGHPEDYNQAWKERERRAQSRPWKVPQTPPKSPRGTQEDKGYEEDMEQERGSLSGHEESSGKDSEKEQEQQRPRFAKSLANSVRFCVFNIDSTTKADFWEKS